MLSNEYKMKAESIQSLLCGKAKWGLRYMSLTCICLGEVITVTDLVAVHREDNGA